MTQPLPVTAEPIIEPPIPPTRKFNPILILVAVVLLVVVGAGGIFLGKSLNNSQKSVPPTITPTPLPRDSEGILRGDETADWKTYINKKIGFEFKYPPSFENFGMLTEKYQESEVGFNYCLKPTKETGFNFINPVYAGGGGCFTDTFAVSANSFDYERGSMGSFLDFHGYEKEGPDIKIRRYSALSDPIPQNFYKITTNQNGVEIVKIYGQPPDPDNPLRTDNPGEGFIAALVNTKSKNYPGIAFIANLKTTATEEVFDQILSSIKILPAEETVLPYINYDYKWKNYVAKDLFAISYPKEGFYINENRDKLVLDVLITNINQNQPIDIWADQASVRIGVLFNTNRNYMEERIKQFSVGNSTREKVILDGKEVDKVTTTAYTQNNSSSLNTTYYYLRGIQGYEISIFVSSKDKGELKEKASQILSTFKFLDQG